MCLHVLYLYIPPLISAFPTWIVWRPAELVKRYLLLTNKPLLHFHILSTALLLLLLFWVCVFLVFLMLELQSLVRRLNIYEWSNRHTLYASISGGFSFSLTKFYFVNKLSEHFNDFELIFSTALEGSATPNCTAKPWNTPDSTSNLLIIPNTSSSVKPVKL